MSRTLIVNNRGDVEVDPFNRKGYFDRWHKSIQRPEGIDYFALKGITGAHSEAITRYVLDLSVGKNTARGHRRGPRSYTHLVGVPLHLFGVLRLLEARTHKENLDFTEDDVLGLFRDMRSGKTLNNKGTPYLDVSTYAKVFAAFWRWYMRTSGKLLPDLVQSLDTSADRKPAWPHFTLHDVEKMASIAPRYEYRALIYFLFDSGIRAPKELMNVRVMDLTPIPGEPNLHLNIREETSKTFGRQQCAAYISHCGLVAQLSWFRN